VDGDVDAEENPQEQVCEISICRLLSRQHVSLIVTRSILQLRLRGG
jgi:hypothetical protein